MKFDNMEQAEDYAVNLEDRIKVLVADLTIERRALALSAASLSGNTHDENAHVRWVASRDTEYWRTEARKDIERGGCMDLWHASPGYKATECPTCGATTAIADHMIRGVI
jgi:hypothetical protein